jgi:hypothetical protein
MSNVSLCIETSASFCGGYAAVDGLQPISTSTVLPTEAARDLDLRGFIASGSRPFSQDAKKHRPLRIGTALRHLRAHGIGPLRSRCLAASRCLLLPPRQQRATSCCLVASGNGGLKGGPPIHPAKRLHRTTAPAPRLQQSPLTPLAERPIHSVLLTGPALSQVLRRETAEAGYPKAR